MCSRMVDSSCSTNGSVVLKSCKLEEMGETYDT